MSPNTKPANIGATSYQHDWAMTEPASRPLIRLVRRLLCIFYMCALSIGFLNTSLSMKYTGCMISSKFNWNIELLVTRRTVSVDINGSRSTSVKSDFATSRQKNQKRSERELMDGCRRSDSATLEIAIVFTTHCWGFAMSSGMTGQTP